MFIPRPNYNNAAAPAEDDTPSVARVLLKVGLITKAEKHPDADALYLETVECGEERPRTVISGLAGKVGCFRRRRLACVRVIFWNHFFFILF